MVSHLKIAYNAYVVQLTTNSFRDSPISRLSSTYQKAEMKNYFANIVIMFDQYYDHSAFANLT
jgi:hypothetical protein